MCGNQNGVETELADHGLYEELTRYCESDCYPYHMPGHKRSPEAGAMAQYYGIDITEIDGFDNLHHAEGILQEAQERANRLYGNVETETFYLVNGSTCGVLASVMTAAGRGAELLIARNCHKSVYHAAILQELGLHYYEPPILEEYGICGGVDAREIARLLHQHPNCAAVVITSPTYEGIVSDVRAVADVVHGQDKILIVDEAHGAHLGLQGSTLPSALPQGADLVIHSLHKTLPAMTQTALLHVQGERIDRGRLRRYLSMLQSSSPSYVLMASMDSCIRYMEANGPERYLFMRRQYELFCEKMEKCRLIRIGNMTCGQKPWDHKEIQDKTETGSAACADVKKPGEKWEGCIAGWDIGKLVIGVKDRLMSGQQLYDLLREEYHLQMEMAAERYVLAIMTVMDSAEGWQRLADALAEIDDRIERGTISLQKAADTGWTEKITAGVDKDCGMTAAQAYFGPRKEVPLAEAAGRVAADFINLYPPGIPLVVPGEVISGEMLWRIQSCLKMGLQVQGVTDEGKICVNRAEIL